MNPIITFRISLASLGANKLRSGLTLLGIVIGVSAVISLMAIGQGVQQSITSRIESLGTNLIFVQPGESVQQGGLGGGAGSASTLTLEDAYALEDPVFAPAVKAVAPEIRANGQVEAGRNNTFAQIVGVTPEYTEVRNAPVEEGDFISEGHLSNYSQVAVLGQTIKETLFGNRNPLGQPIRINGRQFEVIGILEGKGGGFFGSQDNQIMVPITTAYYRVSSQRTIRGEISVDSINVQMPDIDAMDSGMRQVATVLRLRHQITGEDDFIITNQQDTIETLEETTNTFVVFLGAIAGHIPAGGRHRNNEHHAGVGNRTHPGNRHPQSHGRQTAGHSPPVHVRGHPVEPGRRGRGRTDRRFRGTAAERPPICGQQSLADRFQLGHCLAGPGCLCGHRPIFRHLPGHAGRQPAPH